MPVLRNIPNAHEKSELEVEKMGVRRMFKSMAAMVVFSLLILAGPALATVVTIDPYFDTRINPRFPDGNFGATDNFYVGNSGVNDRDRGLFQFNLGLTPVVGDGTLVIPTFLDFSFNGHSMDAYLLSAANNTWDELEATWNNKNDALATPWDGGSHDSGITFLGNSGDWTSGDTSSTITIPQAALNDAITNRGGILGMLLKSDSSEAAGGEHIVNIHLHDIGDDTDLQLTYETATVETPQPVVRPGFGKQWVRSHPFNLAALTLQPALVDGPTYSGAGLNTFLVWKRPDELLPIAVSESLPWQFHVSEEMLSAVVIDEINTSNNNNSGNNGWLVNDEPSFLQMAGTADIANYIKQNVPESLVYTNAFPIGGDATTYYGDSSNPGYSYGSYLNDIMTNVQPDVLMYDMYPFGIGGGNGHSGYYYSNLLTIRQVAQSYDVPYWAFIQAYEKLDSPGDRRLSSESDLRFQMFTMLAAGFKGFHYFGYDLGGWRALIDSSDGTTTSLYDAAGPANAEVEVLGSALRFLESTDVRYIPNSGLTPQGGMASWSFGAGGDLLITDVDVDGVPGDQWKDGVIGFFTDDDGEQYFMVTNAFHGENMSAADTLLDFKIEFDPSVTEVLSLDRFTGQQQVLALDVSNILRLALPGGTGMLFKYNTGKGFQLDIADFNSDGFVDGGDLAQWEGNFGANDNADADGDGNSDGADFLIWQRNLTSSSLLSASSAVPEPSSLALTGIGGLLMLLRQRQYYLSF